MRRFLSHVLPNGFHRIRHVGFLANAQRARQIARARELLADRIDGAIARARDCRADRRGCASAGAMPVLRGQDDPQPDHRTWLGRTWPCREAARHIMTKATIAMMPTTRRRDTSAPMRALVPVAWLDRLAWAQPLSPTRQTSL